MCKMSLRLSICCTILVSLLLAYFTRDVQTDMKGDLRKLTQSDITITKDNIRGGKCHFPGYCFQLTLGRIRHRQHLEEETNLCTENPTKPCMRVNVKPLDEKCERFQFYLGGVDIGVEREIRGAEQYIGIGLKQKDYKMPHSLALYCTPGHFRFGVIGPRNVEKVVSVAYTGSGNPESWYENEPANQSGYSEYDRTFFSCSFTVKTKLTGYTTQMGNVDIGLGEWYLLMAFGMKTRRNTDDMLWNLRPSQNYFNDTDVDDRHLARGHTQKKFADNKKWIVCSAPFHLGTGSLLLTSFLILKVLP